jgi:hypothetical protein
MSEYNIDSTHSLPGKITFSQPISFDVIQNNIKIWLKKWEEFWPQQLTIGILTENLQCVFIPYWILYASASGSWSASIGVDKEKNEICWACKGTRGYHRKNVYGDPYFSECGVCNGKGQTKKSYTEWYSQAGVANGSINGKIRQNTTQEIKLRCGKRDFSADEIALDVPFTSNIFIFQPKNLGDGAGHQIAERIVQDEVYNDARRTASGLGRVKDLRISQVHVDGLDVRTWLYPVFLGSYIYENKLHQIEIDGVTGKLHIVVPESVKAKRTKKIMKIVGIVLAIVLALAIVIGGVFAVGYGIWWLGSNYFMLW